MTIFKSPESEQVMRDWYDRFSSALPYEWESVTVDTSFGPTHVIVTGPEDGIPVVVLHGALAGAAHALGQTGDFGTRHRVYGVDIIGQSVRSAQYRPDNNTDEYGRWLVEVLDGLALEKPVLWGVSWGGFVAIKAAAYAPERVGALMLLNPGGMVDGSIPKAMLQVTLPMLWYWLFPTAARRDWAYSGLFTQPDPELWSPFIVDAMKHVQLDFVAPPLAADGDLSKLTAPVLVHAADQDIQFPGEAVLARAAVLFPNLKATHLLKDCKHCPPFDDAFTVPWLEKVEAFLETEVRRDYMPIG